MKLFRVVLKQYLFHLFNIFISVFLLAPLWVLFDKAQIAYSTVTAIIYCITMYSIGWNCGNLDGRKIPGYFPDYKFPFIAAGLGIIIPVILLILRFAFPDIWQVNLPFLNGETDFLFKGNCLHGMTDFIFRIWYFPFEAFLVSGSAVVCIAIIFVQPVMLTVGYFVGTKRFCITEVLLTKLVYEKRAQKGQQADSKIQGKSKKPGR